MADDLADDIAELIAPDSPLEMRLAGRTISELHHSRKATETASADMKAMRAELGELKETVQKLADRPTIGTLVASALKTDAGKTIATGLAQVLVWVILAITSWATGIVEIPALQPDAPVVVPATPGAP